MLPRFDDRWDHNDPAGTEARFCALLPQAEAAGDRAYLAELLTQIARTEGLQRRFDEAEATLERAAALLGDEDDRARIRLHLERGRVLNSSGRREEARPRFDDAWAQARAAGEDGLAVDAAHMIAIVDPEAALRWNETALELAIASSDPDARRWRGSLCNNIGWTHHAAGAYPTALAFFERALEHRREQGTAEDIRVARWCLARCLRSLDRIDEALAIQREIEADAEGDGFVPEEIAECLLAQGRADDARPYFARAYALLSGDPWLADAEPQRLERLRQRGQSVPEI